MIRTTADGVPTRMTVEEFTQRQPTLRCLECQRVGVLVTERVLNNGALQVVCGACHARRPCGPVLNLKQTAKVSRAEYPADTQTVEQVWERFGHNCIVCGMTDTVLRTRGVGLQRHHTTRYVEVGHDTLIVPICTVCHPIVTALQRAMQLLCRDVSNGLTP